MLKRLSQVSKTVLKATHQRPQSTMASQKKILTIFGATGNQGGSVIKSILAYGRGFVIGEGSNVIDTVCFHVCYPKYPVTEIRQVNINDLISLLKLVINHAVAANGELLTSTTPYERYYIAGTGTVTFREILTAITTVMHRRGLVSTKDLAPARYEDIDQFRA